MLRRLRRKRVLLLDDDPSMQRLVSALLKRGGYRVDTFLTGREAIAALERDGYDVLLLDLMMPHEGGNTVIKHLRAHNPALLEHALLVTASPEAVLGRLTKEVAGVVRKPFDSDELLGAVKRVSGK
ncbi:MAG TPA: response regulator [Thermoanaerobaculia bacterium]|jgi:CheY-like chemotaxis protein